MPSLSRDLRRLLEKTIAGENGARQIAEDGAERSLQRLAVDRHEPHTSLTPEERTLRNQLRAHGRQLGDKRDPQRGHQTITHLKQAVGYEHWHRMLFARFLVENDLLLHPEHGVALSLQEVKELALNQQRDWIDLAAEFAQRMLLSAVFSPEDPALRVALPPEKRQELELSLNSLPREVFLADDSLGWVYQFWQKDAKDKVNRSEVRIGADELAPVTQLFTEDYMVLFLLENTLGAWWTARRGSSHLPDYQWTFLRLGEDGTPSAGSFASWPRTAKELRVLDPCMGSGHFLTFALPILARMRKEEEGFTFAEAVTAVLRDNLFGLELDPRCSQIAAFNLALSAWKLAGRHIDLPQLNLACSGLAINANEEEWGSLAGAEDAPRTTMRKLYRLFDQAPLLGSLIEPNRLGKELFAVEFEAVVPLLQRALASQQVGDDAAELAIAARGVVAAARTLAKRFTLVSTNVPYLGRVKQDERLKRHLDDTHPAAKWDLATAFVERCQSFCAEGGSFALITPQQWWFGDKYAEFRRKQIREYEWDFLVRLGTNAFTSITGEVVNVVLYIGSCKLPDAGHKPIALELGGIPSAEMKAEGLRSLALQKFEQARQTGNPDSRITLNNPSLMMPLSAVAKSTEGLSTGDGERHIFKFWEKPIVDKAWRFLQSAPPDSRLFCGMNDIVRWEEGKGEMARSEAARVRGHSAWGKPGIVVAKMNSIRASIYMGGLFAKNCVVLSPRDADDCSAVLEFVLSPEFKAELETLDSNLNTATSVFEKVPFDPERWKRIARERYKEGFPVPDSPDMREGLFAGNPTKSSAPLQVAVIRLLGYEWPRQTGLTLDGCPVLCRDGLEVNAIEDGIVPLNSLKGNATAADGVRAVLAKAFGGVWSAARLSEPPVPSWPFRKEVRRLAA